MSFTVSKMPTGRACILVSGGLAGYRRAGQAICLCLQMAGAAATKGQQNVTRTRPYSAGTTCLWRGEGTPRWNNTWTLSLVCTNNNMPLIAIHVVGYQAAGGLFQFSLPSPKPEYLSFMEISGCTFPSGSPVIGMCWRLRLKCLPPPVLPLPTCNPPAATQPG